jgi:hypothetical protein
MAYLGTTPVTRSGFSNPLQSMSKDGSFHSKRSADVARGPNFKVESNNWSASRICFAASVCSREHLILSKNVEVFPEWPKNWNG